MHREVARRRGLTHRSRMLLRYALSGASVLLLVSCSTEDLILTPMGESPVASIALGPSPVSIAVGGTVELAVTATDAGGTTVSDPAVEWSSGNELVAIVEPDGTVTGVGPGVTTVTATVDSTIAVADVTVESSGTRRSFLDRADGTVGPQIHVVYAVPSDGVDRGLDTTGVLERSIETTQRWLASQTGGRRLRFDTHDRDVLDISFRRLARNDSTLNSRGIGIRNAIEAELEAAGFLDESKIYAVYYDGTATDVCGGGAWPPQVFGNVAAVYLKGRFSDGSPPCSGESLGESTAGYFDFAMLHEIMHTLGIVSRDAPNHAREGHVDTDPTDLMYGGPLRWTPEILDVNGMNYFNPDGLPDGLYNLATSPFLTP